MKKYLFGLLVVPIMSPLLSIASADSVNGYTSDSKVCSKTVSTQQGDSDYYIDNFVLFDDGAECYNSSDGDYTTYFCISTNLVPYSIGYFQPDYDFVSVSSNNYCFSTPNHLIENTMGFDKDGSYTFYFSKSPITYSAPSAGDSSSVIPELSIPSSFTSGITDLVNNFGSTVANWLPTVILITLGITAIFALFRVVRSYARRSFKG